MRKEKFSPYNKYPYNDIKNQFNILFSVDLLTILGVDLFLT